jgi:hypothetical protein
VAKGRPVQTVTEVWFLAMALDLVAAATQYGPEETL